MNHPNGFFLDEHPEARRFPPLAAGVLDALEASHALAFCDDYRGFLAARNGYDFDSVVTALPRPADFELIDYVRYLFGAGTGFKYNELATAVSNLLNGLGRAYLSFCYPVGDCQSGDLLVQIAKGRFRGCIMLIDHNVCMTAEAFEQAYRRTIADCHPDTLIPWLCRSEAFVPLAPTLAVFLAALQVMRTAAGNTNVAIVAGGCVGELPLDASAAPASE
jgi:hypothetical protein